MKLTICGRKYTIKHGPIGENFGLCEPATATITLSPDLEKYPSIAPEMIELHEIIHAIMFETGLTSLVPARVEEAITSGLAIQLHNLGYRR